MIALMQRGILLALVMAAVAWLGWTLGSGHGSWAWLGLILLTGGHALALAIEFGWMHAVNGRDSAPRARSGQVLIAWLGECSHAPRVFCWRQPFRARRYADMLSEESSRRGVVLVHGFFCNRGLWNRWLARLHTDGTPTIALNLEPPFGSIDDYAPEIGRAVAVLTQRTGKAPVVVAHSMGGLALRHWWNGEGNIRRIHHAITLGTPHRGTRVAILATSVNGRQMRPDSAWSLVATQTPPPMATSNSPTLTVLR